MDRFRISGLILALAICLPTTSGAADAPTDKTTPTVTAPTQAPKRSATSENPLWAGWLRPVTGVYNISRKGDQAVHFGLEYYWKKKLWIFQPFFGMQYNTTHDFYGYFGTGIDFYFTRSFYISPSFALGYYKHTRGVDLGFPLEFREGIEVGWHFENEIRAGLLFFHMSNSQLGTSNPGQETFAAVVSIPIFVRRPARRLASTPQTQTLAGEGCSCAVPSLGTDPSAPRREPSSD